MEIGPLTSQPSLTPFAQGFFSALRGAGVADGRRLYLPTGVTDDGAIAYGEAKVGYVPLGDARGSFDRARSLYAKAGGPARGRPRFFTEVKYLERASSRGGTDVGDALERAKQPSLAAHATASARTRYNANNHQILGDVSLGRMPPDAVQGSDHLAAIPIRSELPHLCLFASFGKAAWEVTWGR